MMTKIYRIFLAFLFFACPSLHAAIGNLTVVVPKTAYLEFLTNSTDAMTSVNGDNTFAIDPYVGGAVTQMTSPVLKDIYLGVMCNSLAGYDLTLTASNAGATASTGAMTVAGGTAITYNTTLTKIASSFTAGTIASTSLRSRSHESSIRMGRACIPTTGESFPTSLCKH